MPILLDEALLMSDAPPETLGDALADIGRQIPAGRVIVKVELDGAAIEGPALSSSRATSLAGRALAVSTANQQELSWQMLGKLHAFIVWLQPRHQEAAKLFETGKAPAGLEKLGQILNGWMQIQQAYGKLAEMQQIDPATLMVRELTAQTLINEFAGQLREIHKALEAQDFVLLADILQYEMDGVVANWTAILESTLEVVGIPDEKKGV